MPRNLDRRCAVLAFMGERSVHYSKVAEFLGIPGADAHQLMRSMTIERLLVKIATGTWRATGLEPERSLDRIRARPVDAGVPLLARVW